MPKRAALIATPFMDSECQEVIRDWSFHLHSTHEVRRRLAYELAGVSPLTNLPSPAECAALRKSAGASMEVVANAVGVSWLTIRSWENGATHPTGRRWHRYAHVLAALQAMSDERVAA